MKIINPKILTLITTYRCTSACENCCFNCDPSPSKKMSLNEMKKYIDCCVREFPTINVVVFTGGECTLLKKDLLEAIRYCSGKKIITRIVTNGHWGKLRESARTMLNSLTEAGLNEINLSTGKDHLKYVPLSNITTDALKT